MILMSVGTTLAGGPFESVDLTNAGPSPIPGHVLARVIGIKWDPRTIPVQYRVNNTLDPVPQSAGPGLFERGSSACGFRGVTRCLEFDPNRLHRFAHCWNNEQPGSDPVRYD